MMEATVYTTTTCPYCNMVKAFLSQRGVPFREKDVSRNQAAAREMVNLSGQQGVPVTVIDGEIIVGFDRGRFEQVLARPSRPRASLGAKVAGAKAVARKRGISLPDGAYIGGVKSGSPAEQAGLRRGDVLVSLDGRPVRGASDLQRVLSSVLPGQMLELVWWRNGQELDGWLQL